jgi:uncharacterized protein DUF5996
MPLSRARCYGGAMNPRRLDDSRWPSLPLAAWSDTCTTLHLWMQVVGKLTLATTPLENHWWNVAYQLTSRGLATRAMSLGDRTLTAAFDFIAHRLELRCSDGRSETVALEPRSVADFHRAVRESLARMRIEVPLWPVPVEMQIVTPFDQDTAHASYDPRWANACWRALASMWPVLDQFRCRFVGKASPVHFFWGSFDLAASRFSGRRAAPQPEADAVTREAYSHEVISHGWWPGGGAVDDAAFYAYIKPEPERFRDAAVRPAAAYYHDEYREFVLPYEAVRSAASPEAELTAFLESTYEAAAGLAHWKRAGLER